MDFIGTFKLLPQEHQYALTVIDMLTNYTWYMPLFKKEAEDIGHAYIVNMYSTFGGLHKILSDNGTEFKTKLFVKVASTLGMKWVFSSSYYP